MNIPKIPAMHQPVVVPLRSRNGDKAHPLDLVPPDGELKNPGEREQARPAPLNVSAATAARGRYSEIQLDSDRSKNGTVLPTRVKLALNAYLSLESLPQQEERNAFHRLLGVDYYI